MLAARVVHTQITNFADPPRATDELPGKDCVRTQSCGTFGGLVDGDVLLGEGDGDGLADGEVVLGEGDGLSDGDELADGDVLGDALPEGLADELSPADGDDEADLDGDMVADVEGLAGEWRFWCAVVWLRGATSADISTALLGTESQMSLMVDCNATVLAVAVLAVASQRTTLPMIAPTATDVRTSALTCGILASLGFGGSRPPSNASHTTRGLV